MNRRLQWTVGLVLLVWGTAASAQVVFNYLGYKMLNTRDYPFRYYMDSRSNTPAGIALSEVEKATRAAFQTWEDVPTAYPAFLYAGTSTSAGIPGNVGDSMDAFNVSPVWITTDTDPYYRLALESGQAPSGSIPLTYAGYLIQCDIYLNAVPAKNFRWTTVPDTDPQFKFRDVQTVLTHEVGHCLGFADVYTPTSSVMNPNFPLGGNRRTLDPQDVQQISEYYPDKGAVGSPCSASVACTNNLKCIPYKNSSGVTLYQYCSKSCPNLSPGECPDPFVCRASTATGGTNACLAVPGEAVTQVGKECTKDADCGSPRSVCQLPTTLPSGGTAWFGGYCQENCVAGASTSVCPAGSTCVELGAQDRCLKPCRPGTGDCRDGYTCSPLAEGNICVPNCYSNDDCNGGSASSAFSCRVCDRVCIDTKPSGLSVGDPCTSNDQCGTNQYCLSIERQAQGICTQSCNSATCSCPTGSSCKSVGPDHVCMKDCAAGTCATPLVCNPVGDTYSCTAACRFQKDCPTGYECFNGACYDPDARPDGGCALCSDGGPPPPPPPPPTDGGTGGGTTPTACGCGEAPASGMVLFGVLALVLAGRRRSWQRP
jgi:hypothetical protein